MGGGYCISGDCFILTLMFGLVLWLSSNQILCFVDTGKHQLGREFSCCAIVFLSENFGVKDFAECDDVKR